MIVDPVRRIVTAAVPWMAALCVVTAPAARQPDLDTVAGAVVDYTVTPGDSLSVIAARFGVATATLASGNGIDPRAPLYAGRTLRIDARHLVPVRLTDGVIVNVPQRMLFVWREGRLAAAYPVAAGRRTWPTPVGRFTIAVKEVDPTWEVPASIQREMAAQGRRVLTVVPPGPANPLGDRWIGLRNAGIGLHGTNATASISSLTTHGCIRLHPDDVHALFDLVEIGWPVQIIYAPVMAAIGGRGEVWLEVHPDAYGRAGDLQRLAARVLADAAAGRPLDPAAVRGCVTARAGTPCTVSIRP